MKNSVKMLVAAAAVLVLPPGLAQASAPESPEVSAANQCPPEQITHNENLVWQLAAADMNDLQVLRETADKLFAVDYRQHNPLVTDLQGREGFVEAMKRLVTQGIPARYPTPMLVFANCKYAAAMILFKRPDGDNPGSTYNSYWFDMWRIEDGKFVEHWDQAIKGQDYDWDIVLPLNGSAK